MKKKTVKIHYELATTRAIYPMTFSTKELAEKKLVELKTTHGDKTPEYKLTKVRVTTSKETL